MRLLLILVLCFITPLTAQAETFSLTLPKQPATLGTGDSTPSLSKAAAPIHIEQRCQALKDKLNQLHSSDPKVLALRETERNELIVHLSKEIAFYCHPSFGLMQREGDFKESS